MIRRLTIFCHYDKDNIIDEYVFLYLKALKAVSDDIYFVSNAPLEADYLAAIAPYVKQVTLRQNTGLDFGAWKEIIQSISFPSILGRYDELILANDSCYAPFSFFVPLFDRMSKARCDMWGVTENEYPKHTFDNQTVVSLAPHLQSYFLVFRAPILESACFADFWTQVDPCASRDTVICEYEAGLTALLRMNNFVCLAAYPAANADFQKIRKIYGEPLYDLSIFYWYALLHRDNPLLKVKAIPATLKWNKRWLRDFKRSFEGGNEKCSFDIVDKHLLRVSMEYKLSKISVIKKITLLFLYCLNRSPANIYASLRFKSCKNKIRKYYTQGGALQIGFAIVRLVKRKIISFAFHS